MLAIGALSFSVLTLIAATAAVAFQRPERRFDTRTQVTQEGHRGGTMELLLSTEEQELLLQLLEQRHLELQKEISHTDHREFKQALRKNEKLIESMLNRLRVGAVA